MTFTKEIKIAKYLCLFPGLFLIISGILILLLPNLASVLFDINDIDKLQEPISLAMGIRQLAIGLMITVLALTNQIKALAYIMLIGAIVPIADFFIFSSLIGWSSALRHAAPLPMIIGLGIYLRNKIRQTS